MTRLFDPHIHMYSRTTDDYDAMSKAGIEVIVQPSFWLGSPRTSDRFVSGTAGLYYGLATLLLIIPSIVFD